MRRGVVKWDEITRADQERINANRHALGLVKRPITAPADVVSSPERTEEEDVPVWQGA